MKFLLDSHVLLWWLENPSRLGPEVQETFQDTASGMFVSSATIWELSIKAGLGRLRIDWSAFRDEMDYQEMEPLPVSIEHGIAAGLLPHHHRDPFDRMLAAQASCEELTLVTHDRALEPYDVAILWA